MIDFRYHLVSVIAIFFALSIGIVLGAGPLSDDVDSVVAQQVADLRTENQGLRDQAQDVTDTLAFGEAFGEAVSPTLTEGALADRLVLMVALPDADPDLLAASADAVVAAGGGVVGTLEIDPAWTEVGQDAVLDTLAAQLVSSGTKLKGEDGWTRGAEVLAGAVLEPDAGKGGAGPSQGARPDLDVLTAYQEAGLLTWGGPLRQTADLALVVAAGAVAAGEDADRAGAAFSGLISAIDAAGSGEVVGGGPASARTGGVVALVREDPLLARDVSTLDMLDTSSGRTVAVLALVEQAAGGAGQYGAVDGVDGPLPESALRGR